jgi:endonuclease/exonuclease/phosphatase (EEP) superfamily protein YafD
MKSKLPQKIKVEIPKKSLAHIINHLGKVIGNKSVEEVDSISEFGTPKLKELPSKNLRIAIWNLCKGVWEMRFVHDFETLLRKCDLLLAQEALLGPTIKRAFHFPGFHALHAACYKRRDGLLDGVMTISSAKDIGSRKRVLCHRPEPLLKTSKATLISFYHLSGSSEPLMIVNMHARLIKTKQGAIDEIKYLLSVLPEHKGPIIFGGDFNTYRKSYLEGVINELGQLDFQHIEVGEDPRRRIDALDQVFVRGFEIKASRVDTTISHSDHFPIIAELSLKT